MKLARMVRGHFVTLIEVSMRLIKCNPKHISGVIILITVIIIIIITLSLNGFTASIVS